MLKRIALILTVCFPLAAFASEGGGHPPYWEQPHVNVNDKASLQRGARMFANYCMGCHQARYQRWMHTAEDLGLPEKVVEDNLIWTTQPGGKRDTIGSLMTNAMPASFGVQSFGKAPPDLTLKARERGPAWIYNYLRTFYVQESSPTGVDNAVLPGASMPHVLWSLQGWQRPVYEENPNGEGQHIVDFELVKKGSMSPEEYDRALGDLVNFMAYLGEPAQLDRTAIGGWVILFLLVFVVFAYFLKKEYWKDVH